MPSAVDITFPRDTNHEAIPVLSHDFGEQAGMCVMLAGSSITVTADALYRVVGNTDAIVAYGRGDIVALCRIFGMQGFRLPQDQIEYILPKAGQTTISIVSEYADGGCFDVIRMR